MKRSEILASQNMKAAEAGVLEWELRTTFSPMQAVLSSKDTKLGRGAGKLIDHGTRFCEGPNKSLNSSWSALTLLLIPHLRP